MKIIPFEQNFVMVVVGLKWFLVIMVCSSSARATTELRCLLVLLRRDIFARFETMRSKQNLASAVGIQKEIRE